MNTIKEFNNKVWEAKAAAQKNFRKIILEECGLQNAKSDDYLHLEAVDMSDSKIRFISSTFSFEIIFNIQGDSYHHILTLNTRTDVNSIVDKKLIDIKNIVEFNTKRLQTTELLITALQNNMPVIVDECKSIYSREY